MRRTNTKYLNSASIAALLVAGAAAGAPTVAIAQQASDSVIEEIIVTARKRSESLQDVPFSIAAKTEDAMRNAGINSLEDLSTAVASFTIQNLGPGQSQVAMRGVSSGQIARDLPGVKEQVGIYLDESVISLSLFTPDLDLFDLNRVEVLRGPQGTLFGSGSESGTVRYITNRPNLDTTEGVAEVNGAFIDGGDFTGSIKGVVNFPIAEGKAALRVVGAYTKYGGFIDATQPGGSVISDINDGERISFRAALELHPSENLTITPRIIYQDINIDGFNRIDVFNILANEFTTTRPAIDLGKRGQFTQVPEGLDDEFMLIDATIQYEGEGFSITSVSSYTDRDVVVARDSTQLSGSVIFQFFDQTEGVFNLDAPLDDITAAEVFTQELRVASNDDGPIQWVIGGFYSKIERRYQQILNVTGFEAAIGIPTAGFLAETDQLFRSDIPYDFKQIAFFGEASYDVNERLNVTAGLRWFDFDEKRLLNFDGIFAAPTNAQPGNTSSNGVSPRVMVSYDASDEIVLNAQASKGFRLGGVNDPLNEGACPPGTPDFDTFSGRENFGDETLWNYEVGAKAKIMDGRGTFNVAAFYTPINNMQFTVDAGLCSSRIIFNADARSMGVEAELFVQPTDNFEFGVVGSLIDSEIREDVASAGLIKGARLPTVPKFQASASATYTAPVMDQEGFITATVQHVGSRFTQAADTSGGDRTVDLTAIPVGAPSVSTFTFSPKMPAYQLANLRFGIRNDQWELAVYVNNVFDERAFLALDRERGFLARVGFLTNQPRTFGFSARSNF